MILLKLILKNVGKVQIFGIENILDCFSHYKKIPHVRGYNHVNCDAIQSKIEIQLCFENNIAIIAVDTLNIWSCFRCQCCLMQLIPISNVKLEYVRACRY
jgi:hypothetical protein